MLVHHVRQDIAWIAGDKIDGVWRVSRDLVDVVANDTAVDLHEVKARLSPS
jgi:hypothetical protein